MSNFNLGRHIKEGFKNFTRNKLMTFISLISIIITMSIVGVFTLILLNVTSVTNDIESNVEAVVYVDIDANDEDIDILKSEIENIDLVDEVTFIHKDEGLERLIEDLGEEGKAFESLKEDNPLNHSFIVRTFEPRDAKEVAIQISNFSNVYKVDYGEDIINILFNITENLRKIGFGLVLGLIIVAMLLTANTIKMTIEIRKEEVKIMKLVGSTNMFIRMPFIIEGIILSLVGSVIPLLAIFYGYSRLIEEYNNSVAIQFTELLSLSEVMIPISILLLGLSVFIGVIGSLISIRRYLKI